MAYKYPTKTIKVTKGCHEWITKNKKELTRTQFLEKLFKQTIIKWIDDDTFILKGSKNDKS